MSKVINLHRPSSFCLPNMQFSEELQLLKPSKCLFLGVRNASSFGAKYFRPNFLLECKKLQPSSAWQAGRYSARHKRHEFYGTENFTVIFFSSPPLFSAPSQINPFHPLPTCFHTSFITILPSMPMFSKWVFSFGFSHLQNLMSILA